MEKKNIEISYKGTGIRMFCILGTVFYILGAAGFLGTIIAMIYNAATKDISAGASFVSSIILMFRCLVMIAVGALCKYMSSTGRTALYQRSIIEADHNFINKDALPEEEAGSLDEIDRHTA